MRARGLTLMELLTVIAIIALLIALALPVIHQMRYKGRDAVCISNMRQLWTAIMLYRDDHNGKYPYPTRAIAAYTKNKDVFHCPVDTGHHELPAQRVLARVEGIEGLSYQYLEQTWAAQFVHRYAPPHDNNYGILVCYLHPITNLQYRYPTFAPHVRRVRLDGSIVTVRRRPPNPDELSPSTDGSRGDSCYNMWSDFTNAPCPPEYCRQCPGAEDGR